MTEGRRLLIALLQRTKARAVAARCSVQPPAVSKWASGYQRPAPRARRELESNYGIAASLWGESRRRV